MLMTTPSDESLIENDSCREENLRPGAAVLPWKKQTAASSPEGSRIWGKALAEQVDKGSIDFVSLLIRLDEAKVIPIDQVRQLMNPRKSIEAAKPRVLSPGQLHRLYAGTPVPEHRYLAPWLAVAVSSLEIALNPAKWLGEITRTNPSSVVNAWLNTNCNNDYEQLHGIGLDPDTGQLTAALTLRQGSGYSGEPWTAGSSEYVAFWVDWGSGFQYEGTASAVVYDFSSLPADGLKYNVSLPGDFRTHAQHCGEKEMTVKVRAVLSWNTPSSAIDPDAPVVWGNSLESMILIPFVKTFHAGNWISSLSAPGDTDIEGSGCVTDHMRPSIGFP
jgi:hypothetical protein